MGHPRDLDEYTDDEFFSESIRRRTCKLNHVCRHCGHMLDTTEPCSRHAHNTPMVANAAIEATLQLIAHSVDALLPTGRGFAVVVANTQDALTEGSRGHYVSNLNAEEVPEVFRTMANYIERREAAKD